MKASVSMNLEKAKADVKYVAGNSTLKTHAETYLMGGAKGKGVREYYTSTTNFPVAEVTGAGDKAVGAAVKQVYSLVTRALIGGRYDRLVTLMPLIHLHLPKNHTLKAEVIFGLFQGGIMEPKEAHTALMGVMGDSGGRTPFFSQSFHIRRRILDLYELGTEEFEEAANYLMGLFMFRTSNYPEPELRYVLHKIMPLVLSGRLESCALRVEKFMKVVMETHKWSSGTLAGVIDYYMAKAFSVTLPSPSFTQDPPAIEFRSSLTPCPMSSLARHYRGSAVAKRLRETFLPVFEPVEGPYVSPPFQFLPVAAGEFDAISSVSVTTADAWTLPLRHCYRTSEGPIPWQMKLVHQEVAEDENPYPAVGQDHGLRALWTKVSEYIPEGEMPVLPSPESLELAEMALAVWFRAPMGLPKSVKVVRQWFAHLAIHAPSRAFRLLATGCVAQQNVEMLPPIVVVRVLLEQVKATSNAMLPWQMLLGVASSLGPDGWLGRPMSFSEDREELGRRNFAAIPTVRSEDARLVNFNPPKSTRKAFKGSDGALYPWESLARLKAAEAALARQVKGAQLPCYGCAWSCSAVAATPGWDCVHSRDPSGGGLRVTFQDSYLLGVCQSVGLAACVGFGASAFSPSGNRFHKAVVSWVSETKINARSHPLSFEVLGIMKTVAGANKLLAMDVLEGATDAQRVHLENIISSLRSENPEVPITLESGSEDSSSADSEEETSESGSEDSSSADSEEETSESGSEDSFSVDSEEETSDSEG